jgi:protein-disulfide isomerase
MTVVRRCRRALAGKFGAGRSINQLVRGGKPGAPGEGQVGAPTLEETAMTDVRCDELSWGRGPRVLDVFLEPTCPHCSRAFGKLRPLLEAAGEDRLTLRLRMQSQPWHLFSGVVTRAILAASTTEGGKAAAWRVMEEVYAHRDDFVCVDHSSGPNLEASLAEMLRRIEALTGLELGEAFGRKEVTTAMTRHARFARQNGIHVSPTFMVDGLVNDRMGSRDAIAKWLDDIGLG